MNCATHNDVAAVAFCRTCGKALCNQCTRDVRGVIYCEACLAARMEGTPSAPATPNAYPPVGGSSIYAPPPPAYTGPNPTVAGILGAIPLGLGAVYCGQYVKGLIHLGIFVMCIIAQTQDIPGAAHAALGIFLGFFWIYQIIDAVRTARAIQAGDPVPDPFGLVSTFGGSTTGATGVTVPQGDAPKVPIAAAILIALGVLFLLSTAFDFNVHRYWALTLVVLGVYLFAKHWGLLGTYRPDCVCERCRTRKLMGPAILVTLGVIFLLDSNSNIDFWKTWPAILLVIGVVKLFQSNASTTGHVGPLPGAPPSVRPTPPPIVTPPPQATPGTEQSSSSGEVKNV